MTDQEMLTRLKSTISPTLGPVKPLRTPAVRAVGLGAAFVVLIGGVFAALGPRDDVALPDFWGYVGFSMLQVACGYMLVVAGLRMSIPGRSTSPSTALAAIGVAIAVHLAASWAAVEHSVTAPAPGHAWQSGLDCLGAIVLLGLAPVAWGAVLLLRGLVTERLLAFALIGLAGALGAEAAWRLHCDYSTWDHILPYHSGAMLLLTLAVTAAANHPHGRMTGGES